MTKEVVIANTVGHWVNFLFPLLKVIISVVVAFAGTTIGKYFLSKSEKTSLESKEALDSLAKQRLNELVVDGIHYVEENVIRKGKVEGKDAKKDEKFRKEAEAALINFVRNMAGKYNVEWLVKNFSDEDIISLSKALLNAMRAMGRLR